MVRSNEISLNHFSIVFLFLKAFAWSLTHILWCCSTCIWHPTSSYFLKSQKPFFLLLLDSSSWSSCEITSWSSRMGTRKLGKQGPRALPLVTVPAPLCPAPPLPPTWQWRTLWNLHHSQSPLRSSPPSCPLRKLLLEGLPMSLWRPLFHLSKSMTSPHSSSEFVCTLGSTGVQSVAKLHLVFSNSLSCS